MPLPASNCCRIFSGVAVEPVAPVVLLQDRAAVAEDVVRRAIDEARSDDGRLVLLSVLDPAAASKVADQFLETGHVGTRPSSDVSRSLHARQEQFSHEQAEEVSAQARAGGVSLLPDLRRGELVAETTKALKHWRPSAVVVEGKPHRLLPLPAPHAFLEDLARRLGFRLIQA